MSQQPVPIMDDLRRYLAEIGRTKQATEGVGKTTHPVMDADDGDREAREGARAAEHESDIKKEIPISVDATPDAPSGVDAADATFQIGTRKSEVGGDPAVEDNYDGFPHEPGTSHPAKGDEGRKYGSHSFDQLAPISVKLANALLAEIAVGRNPAGAPPPSSAADKAAQAARAGYAAAAALGGAPSGLGLIEGTVKEAARAAILAADYLEALPERLAKRADPADGDPTGGPPPPGAPPAPLMPIPGGPDGHGPGGPPDMASLLGGGPGGPPPAPSPDGGGMPPDADRGEVMHELVAVMQEMGISPEELIQIMSQGGDGAEGPEAGGPPPEEKVATWTKIASDVKRYRRSGKYAYATPATKRAARIRSHLRNYLAEMAGA